jgi:site-specific DNA recombinase
MTLLEVFDELDVSGGAPLAQRPGLSRAVEMVEQGDTDVVVVAYFDRLVRSLAVQAEVVDRVEQAGGAILAVDVGHVTNGSAGQWLSGTMLGAVSEYHRRVTAERTEDAKRRAIADGRPTFPNIPPGLRLRKEDGRLEPHPTESTIVRDAFELRASGATVREVREFLRANGIERSFHGVQVMLTSRMYLGELRFGEYVNAEAHPAIVDLSTWQKVQRMRASRGRRAKSERLLARLGVLRCGTCGGRMVVGSQHQQGKRYAMYRCSPVGDCPRRMAISAEIAEEVVWAEAERLTAGIRGTASLGAQISEAEQTLAVIEERIGQAVRAFAGLEDVSDTGEVLAELRERRDQASDRLAELRRAAPSLLAVSANDATLAGKRDIIRAVIERAVVAPGRGRGRITVEPRVEQ